MNENKALESLRSEGNKILAKYRAKFAEYQKDYAFLAQLFEDVLIDIDELLNAEN